MAAVKNIPVGKVEVPVTLPTKHAVTLPAKKAKAIKAVPFEKDAAANLSPRMKHIHKMAEKFIQSRANATATRRARAVRVQNLKDGRKVYIKNITKQTKRSVSNPNVTKKTMCKSGLKDRKDMMTLVHKMKVDNQNKRRLAQLTKAGKKDKFVPKSYDKKKETLVSLVKSKYGAPIRPKRVVKLTNLSEKTKETGLKISLGRTASYVDSIKVIAPKTLEGKKVAYLYTKNEEMAQAVIKHRAGKMKIAGKSPKMTTVALKRGHVAKGIKKNAKKTAEMKAARSKKIKADNHVRHMANLAQAKRRRSRRRHPMFEGPKMLRDPKSHRVYGIKRNPAAKAPKLERGKVNAYKTMRAQVRATRK